MGEVIQFRSLTTRTGEQKDVAILPDGYINLSHICRASGKIVKNWLRFESSKHEIQRVQKQLLSAVPGSDVSQAKVIITVNNVPNTHKGIYGHPRIALAVAMWADETFHDQVLDWLTSVYRGEPVSVETIRNIIFEGLLLPKPATWKQRFPRDFWQALAWADEHRRWNDSKEDHRGSWAAFIGTYVYEEMFKDPDPAKYVHTEKALKELRRRNPYRDGSWDRIARNHQLLTDLGLDRLGRQIHGITSDLKTFASTYDMLGKMPTLDGFKKMFATKQAKGDVTYCPPLELAGLTAQLSLFARVS